jgi:Amt family ammonium transporter
VSKERRLGMDSISAGDAAWLLVSSALVLVMTPALAFFYAGMVRKKNVLSTLNLSFVIIGLTSVQWVLYGYSLAFGSAIGGLIGGLEHLGFSGVGTSPSDYATGDGGNR